jgi:primosomal protein N' (replication factor Y)
VQALIRWDPVGHADAELTTRAEVGLPPAVHMAALDGDPDSVTALLEQARLPDGAEVLGPVPLPPGVRRPAGVPDELPVIRMLARVGRDHGLSLAAALRHGIGVLSARGSHHPVRVQIDPLHIG